MIKVLRATAIAAFLFAALPIQASAVPIYQGSFRTPNTTSTASATMVAVGSSLTISVRDAVPYVVGSYLTFTDTSSHVATGLVTASVASGGTNTVTVTILALSGGAVAGTVFASGSTVTFGGVPCPVCSVSLVPGAALRMASAASVPADGSASFSVTFALPFSSAVRTIVITPSAYSGSDNAIISCRITTSTISGFTEMCAGGASGSTVTTNYLASGV